MGSLGHETQRSNRHDSLPETDVLRQFMKVTGSADALNKWYQLIALSGAEGSQKKWAASIGVLEL